ncbi:hypothetical protein PR001_g21518 [Phytophthora rubi]|nr:hypothetical protein PR001_g21518 [Phytophthora rubi]
MPAAGGRWGGVSRFIAADVAHWLREHEKSTNLLVVEDEV